MKASSEVEALIYEIDRRRLFLSKLLKEIRGAKDGGGWDAVALERILKSAERADAVRDGLSSLLLSTRSKVERDASTAVLELEADIRDLCKRRGWRIDGEWPRLYVERGIEFEADERKRTVRIGGSKPANLRRGEIESRLEKAIRDLIPRGFDPRKFLDQVARAYDEACSRRGGEVPLLEVYRQLVVSSQPLKLWRDARASSFAELTADQFRARLSAALEPAPRSALGDRELRLLPPIDPGDAMFVYQPAERRFGFVGRIEFRPIRENAA